jgi:hypothetical protein
MKRVCVVGRTGRATFINKRDLISNIEVIFRLISWLIYIGEEVSGLLVIVKTKE